MLNKIVFLIILFFIFFEGLVRKGVPVIGTQAFLLKDLIIPPLFFAQLPYIKFRKKFDLLWVAFLIYMLVFVVSLFSLALSETTPYLYALGFREYFFYATLILLGYEYFSKLGNKGMDDFIRKFIYVGFAITSLGIAQSSGILDLDILKSIESVNQEHSSEFGVFYFTASLFDTPEKFAFINLLLFLLLYSSIRCRQKIMRFDYLFLIIFLIGVVISGRRVATFLMLLFVTYDFLANKKELKGVVLMTISVVIFPFIIYFSVQSIDPVLAQLIFSTATLADALFYLNWALGLFLNAFEQVNVLTGTFGITSPGSDIVVGKDSFFAYEIEGFWDKTLISLGWLATLLLMSSFALVLLRVEGIRKQFVDDYLLRAISYCLIAAAVWGIKSGNFLVWTPLTFVVIGLFLARFNSLKSLAARKTVV